MTSGSHSESLSGCVIDPVVDTRWASFASETPAAMIFHHPLWLDLLRSSYGYTVHAVCVERAGVVVAGIPVALVDSRITGRRLVALPFSDVCPPLFRDAGDDVRRCLGQELHGYRLRVGASLEIREQFEDLPGAQAVRLFHLHTIDLSKTPRWSSMTERNVRRARRGDAAFERRTDRDALDAFYALHVRTRRRQGVPTQPRRFIHAFERLFAADLGFVALVHVGGRPAAGAVFVGAGRTLTYKYGASDRSTLGARPNHLLFAEVIGRAASEGYQQLDFGRSQFGQEGLRAFKASWGADERSLAYTFAGRQPASPRVGRGRRALGAFIAHTPPCVGEAVGAALYRHAG